MKHQCALVFEGVVHRELTKQRRRPCIGGSVFTRVHVGEVLHMNASIATALYRTIGADQGEAAAVEISGVLAAERECEARGTDTA